MEQIGAALKEKRLEKGFTLEEISKRTRLQVPYLKAIEAGNIEFFKDDLSYVSFYVRHYATELGLDYNAFRNDIDETVYDYTKSLDVGEVRRNIEISDRIRKQSVDSKSKFDKQRQNNKTSKRRKRYDFSMVAFLVSAVVVLFVLVFVLIQYVPQWLNSDPVTKPPVTEPEVTDPETPDTESPGVVTPEVPKELVITQENDTTYVISNWTESQAIDITLNVVNRTWLQISVDDTVLSNPVSKIYEAGETVHFSETQLAGKTVTFHVGYMNGNSFVIGGKNIELVDSVANLQGSTKIYFKFVDNGGSE